MAAVEIDSQRQVGGVILETQKRAQGAAAIRLKHLQCPIDRVSSVVVVHREQIVACGEGDLADRTLRDPAHHIGLVVHVHEDDFAVQKGGGQPLAAVSQAKGLHIGLANRRAKTGYHLPVGHVQDVECRLIYPCHDQAFPIRMKEHLLGLTDASPPEPGRFRIDQPNLLSRRE